MRDLLRKIGRFGENHVEKIVLIVVGLVCAYLFFTRVIFSPNGVVIDNKTFAPGAIDKYIYDEKTQDLVVKLSGQAGPATKVYRPRMTGPIDPNDPVVADVFVGRTMPRSFMDVFKSPLDIINTDVGGLQPNRLAASRAFQAKYKLPRIGEVTDVAVNHIRAAAYVPTQPLTADVTYDTATVEPNDIDLVTVEAKFDAAGMYRRFYASFAGADVGKEEWRDPCLADPIFAAVQLQRQVLLDDGSWSAWQELPRCQVESHRDLFTVIETVDVLPVGGVKVRQMQFDSKDITLALLQPQGYQIASAEEEWFPPSFYDKFKNLQSKELKEEKRREREADRPQDSQTGGRRDSLRGGTTRDARATTGGRRRGDVAGGAGDAMYGGQGGQDRRSRSRGRTTPGIGSETTTNRRGRTTTGRGRGTAADSAYDAPMYGPDSEVRRQPTSQDVYFEFADALISYDTDLSKATEPVLFWAFDDATLPGHTYRYRVRIGAFNPVAGTDQVVERDMDKKNQVILWSEFSQVTDPVEIRERLYFFAKDAKDRTKKTTVEVARYAQGYWRTEDFQIMPGDVIGEEKEPKKKEEDGRLASGRLTDRTATLPGMRRGGAGVGGGTAALRAATRYPGMGLGAKTEPVLIDYRTGMMLLDVVETNGLDGAPYHDMLYTDDGVRIGHMPISTKNWPRDLLATYNYVKTESRKDEQPFRAFNQSGGRGRGAQQGGYEDMGGGYEDMMYPGGGAGGGSPYGPY